MHYTVFYALASITILYFLFAFFGKKVTKFVGKKICAVCAAVSLTWLSLLVLWFAGLEIELLLIAILMGQSIVGIMYKSEEYFKQKKLRRFWFARLLIIVLGTLFVYFLLKEQWPAFLAVIIVGLLLTAFFLPLTQEKKTEKAKTKEQNKNFQKAVSKLEKLMEDCC